MSENIMTVSFIYEINQDDINLQSYHTCTCTMFVGHGSKMSSNKDRFVYKGIDHPI